jgi:hypothetical protein
MSTHSRQQEDSFARQRETWRRAYVDSPSMRERFRKLHGLTVDVTFNDANKLETYSPQMRSFGPAAKAFFGFACPRTLCLHGGFDLDAIIQALFEAGRRQKHGVLQCHGRLGRSHSDDARCRLEVRYNVQLLYEVSQPGDARRGEHG